jgi:hypothetical protein
MDEPINIASLTRLCHDNLAELRAMRRDLADFQKLAVKSLDALNKIEQRSEASFTIDNRLSEVDTRFAAIDARFAAVGGRLRGIDLRIGDLKGGLESTIRTELMSALGNFEAKMLALVDQRLAGKE